MILALWKNIQQTEAADRLIEVFVRLLAQPGGEEKVKKVLKEAGIHV